MASHFILLLPAVMSLSPDQCDPAEPESQCQLLCAGESQTAPIEEHYMLLLSKETVQMALHFPVVFTHSWGLGWGASASTAACANPATER